MAEVSEYLPVIKSAISEKCASCVVVKEAALHAAKKAVADYVNLDEAIEEFKEFVGDECTGPTIEGECGTKRTVCHHPLGKQALLSLWQQETAL